MKKIILLCICFGLIFSLGCNHANEPEMSNDLSENREELLQEMEDTETLTDSTDSAVKQCYLVESTDENSISLEIPVICNDNKDVKQLVSNFLKDKVYQICGEEFNFTETNTDINESEYSNYFIDINCKSVYSTKSFVSMVFEGFLNYKPAAHPMNIFFALNVDLNSAERILFKDVYQIDNGFFQIFNENVLETIENQADAEWYESFEISDLYTEEIVIQGLQTENEYCVYFNESSLGVSFPVVHSLGDHMEVEIPYTDLNNIEIDIFD